MGLWGIVSINDAGQILATATSAVGIFFSPSDHNGIWAGRLEGVKGKGKLPTYLQEVVERIAKEKGLA